MDTSTIADGGEEQRPGPERGAFAAPAGPVRRPKEDRVFVQLSWAQDAEEWSRRWREGRMIGMNDATPYGYGRAAAYGCKIEYSRKGSETIVGRILRLGLRVLTGFDFVHTWRNRRAILASDVVWTHTEAQFLAVALLLRLKRSAGRRPRLLGQSVWLFDTWEKLSRPKKALYRWLVERVDVLTVHSPCNAAIARRLFPEKPVELVLFGIPTETVHPVYPRRTDPGPSHVLALGNDRHRDWETAIEALGGIEGVRFTILSQTADKALARPYGNVEITSVSSNEELQILFDRSVLMIVPLGENQHASGTTVLQEAALQGIPAIATRAGGLEAYFDERCVTYVAPGDVEAMRRSCLELLSDAGRRDQQAINAQHRVVEGLGCESYVRRHVELTGRLLRGDLASRR